jgi:predicted RNA-binding protein YlqC (UPF0109 family)
MPQLIGKAGQTIAAVRRIMKLYAKDGLRSIDPAMLC